MNLSQRQNEILRLLKEKNYLSVEELSSSLSVSKVTIRSDLTALEEKGTLTRTHGGAMIAEVAPRIVTNSLTEHEAEKKSIGKAAAALIPDDAVIIIDSGSTTFRIAEYILGRSLTVVTNSLLVCDALRNEKDIELMMLGGSFRRNIMGCTGPLTKLDLSQIHADFYFLGGGGYSDTHIYCSNLQEAEVKQAMMKAADTVCFLADSSKKGQALFGITASWDDIDCFITDRIDSSFQTHLESKSIRVITSED
ncbi:MAG: DeoR/GlpR transcriptional regulator [Oscillospiraceae bacterium]|nr:DeoR/GlpR transcriptional regulator [Oscillospiraceae bacterium]